MGIATEYTPEETEIGKDEIIELKTRYGRMSRGKSWGKFYGKKSHPVGDFQWVEKSPGGTILYLQAPGLYVVGSDDGFNRKARTTFTLTERND